MPLAGHGLAADRPAGTAPAGRIGTALLDADGTVLDCDAIWRTSTGAGQGDRLAVPEADRAALDAALATPDERFAIVVRTGRIGGALVAHLLLEGVHRDGVWYVIGVVTYQAAAVRDPLTGLLDRGGFDAALASALDRVARGDAASLLLLDLDGFKRVNDNGGHSAGDRLLREAGMAIAAVVRDGDAAARFGGDEFAVVLRRTAPREARVAAERILRALDGVNGASAGLAHLRPGEPIAAEEAVSRADLALYAAKGSERGGLVEYPSDVDAAVRLRTRLAWGRRLHRALEDDAFALYAEPIVDLRTGVVEGVELQLHLHDGDEYVPRGVYREHALRNGLAERIDRWVLEHAVAPERGDVVIRISSAGLGAVDPGRLVLAVDRMPEDAEALLGRGVRFALDGLGALELLRELPCAQIRLASDLGDGAVDTALIRQAVALGDELGIDVAAGGVETAADAARLRALGVRLGQGPLFGGPHPLSRA